MEIRARVAWACLTALVSSSAIPKYRADSIGGSSRSSTVGADGRLERAVQGQRAYGIDQPALVQHRRVDSADQFAQLGQRGGGADPRFPQQRLGLRPGRSPSASPRSPARARARPGGPALRRADPARSGGSRRPARPSRPRAGRSARRPDPPAPSPASGAGSGRRPARRPARRTAHSRPPPPGRATPSTRHRPGEPEDRCRHPGRRNRGGHAGGEREDRREPQVTPVGRIRPPHPHRLILLGVPAAALVRVPVPPVAGGQLRHRPEPPDSRPG